MRIYRSHPTARRSIFTDPAGWRIYAAVESYLFRLAIRWVPTYILSLVTRFPARCGAERQAAGSILRSGRRLRLMARRARGGFYSCDAQRQHRPGDGLAT